jgi:hypothetical protein
MASCAFFNAFFRISASEGITTSISSGLFFRFFLAFSGGGETEDEKNNSCISSASISISLFAILAYILFN